MGLGCDEFINSILLLLFFESSLYDLIENVLLLLNAFTQSLPILSFFFVSRIFTFTHTYYSTNNTMRSIILFHNAIKIDRIRTHAFLDDILAYFTILRFSHTHNPYARIHLPQLMLS